MTTAVLLALLLALYGWIGMQAVKNAPPRARQQARVRRVIDGDTIVVQFRNGTARTVRLLGIDAPESVHPNKPVQPFSHEAADWLRSVLTEGPRPARDVEKLARDAGLAWRTVQRARGRAGVSIERIGFPARTVWQLPTAPVAPPDHQPRQSRQLQNDGATGATAPDVARLDEGGDEGELI